jgi:hypothetical protein
MAKKTKQSSKSKTYQGTVITEFSVGYASGTITFKVGDVFETPSKDSFNLLVNKKKIK